MRIFFSQRINRVCAALLLLPVLGACTLFALSAANASEASVSAPENELRVQADKLVSMRDANYIQFIGNVDVSVAETRIQSEKLKVYFHQMPSGKQEVSGSNVQKIVATGNVRIEMENRTATCQQAVYRTRTQILVLTGGAVKIKSEGNLISGSKITFHRKSGEIIVDGDPEQRVNAIIQQGGDALLTPQTTEETP